MRFVAAAIAAALLVVEISGPAWAQPAAGGAATPPAKPLTTCEALALDWRSAEYDLAENYAEGMTDDSAPRATMRAAQDQNALLKAQIALTLMHDNKCSLPKRAPSSITYLLNALKCQTEKLKGNFKSPECDHSTWTAMGK